MADFTLSDGREINFNMNAMTLGEYEGLFDSKKTQQDDRAIIARVSGLEPEEFKELGFLDYRRLLAAFFAKARAPLDDPNSASASTST